MTINTSALSSTLQSKVDALDSATETKEVLLLSKALDAAAGSISVNDVLAEGVVQTNNVNNLGATKIAEINTVATNTFKTVGGTSILGSGDIATLPSGGTAGQIIKKDASNNPAWGSVAPAGLLKTTAISYNGHHFFSSTSFTGTGLYTPDISVVGGTSSKFIVNVYLEGEWNHEKQWSVYRSVNGGTWQDCAWGTGSGSPDYGVGHFNFEYDVDNSSTIHNTSAQYIDSPSASSTIAYRVYIRVDSGSMWINRTMDGSPYGTGVCRMTVMEVSV